MTFLISHPLFFSYFPFPILVNFPINDDLRVKASFTHGARPTRPHCPTTFQSQSKHLSQARPQRAVHSLMRCWMYRIHGVCVDEAGNGGECVCRVSNHACASSQCQMKMKKGYAKYSHFPFTQPSTDPRCPGNGQPNKQALLPAFPSSRLLGQ